jgi:hypothetical protein
MLHNGPREGPLDERPAVSFSFILVDMAVRAASQTEPKLFRLMLNA